MNTSQILNTAARQNISNHYVFSAEPAAPVANGAGIDISAAAMRFYVDGIYTGVGTDFTAQFPTSDYTVPVSTTRHYAILYKPSDGTGRIVPLDFGKKGSAPTTIEFEYVQRDEVLVAAVRLTTEASDPFVPGVTLISALDSCYVANCNGIPQDLSSIATYGVDIV